MFSGIILALSLMVSPVLAEENNLTTNATGTTNTAAAKAADMAAKIACVKIAVAARETAIGAAVATHTQAVQAAYSTRANELAGAYSNTTVKTVRAGTKVAWADFTKSIKAASKTWKTNRNTAWSAFRAAVKACKAPSSISDSANSGFEVNGG